MATTAIENYERYLVESRFMMEAAANEEILYPYHHPGHFLVISAAPPMQIHDVVPYFRPMPRVPVPVIIKQVPVLPTPGIINQVWEGNLKLEFKKIRNLLCQGRCFLASIDTEFPGAPFASDLGRLQDPRYNYEMMKANVNATKIIRLGLTLSDGYNFYVWEFNFNDFDFEADRAYCEDSIEFLMTHGTDFERNKIDGFDSSEFAELFWQSELSGVVAIENKKRRIPLTWVGFQCYNDLGYLIKILTGRNLPEDMDGFMRHVKTFFGPSVFDVKHMITMLPPEIKGGLEKVAEDLKVVRAVGTNHMAGSDSLLTLQTFIKLVDERLKPADYIKTLQTLTTKLYFANDNAGPGRTAKQWFSLCIKYEDEREKHNYITLYRCQGTLFRLARLTNEVL